MFATTYLVSIAFPFFAGFAQGLDLDVNSDDSIKSVAKTLAGATIEQYNTYQKTLGAIPGLFNDSGLDWWKWGTTWEGMVEYSHLTGDSQYDETIAQGLTFQVGEFNTFMPINQTKSIANDDQANWALAAMSAAEAGFKNPANITWLQLAQNVFDNQVLRWDDKTCGGGLRWQIFQFNNGYDYKDTFANSAFFLLSARLAHLTGNKTYSEWADKSFAWAQKSGLIDNTFHVFNGADTNTNCSQINHIQFSAPHGRYTEGAALMYNMTMQANADAEKWKTAAAGFAKSESIFQQNETQFIYEVACETNNKCNLDQKIFKGMAARSWSRAIVSAPFISDILRPALSTSAKAAAKACDGQGANLKCNGGWAVGGKGDFAGFEATFNAQELVQTLMYSKVKLIADNAAKNASSPSASGSPTNATGTARPSSTGAAGRMAVGGSAIALAGVVALLGL